MSFLHLFSFLLLISFSFSSPSQLSYWTPSDLSSHIKSHYHHTYDYFFYQTYSYISDSGVSSIRSKLTNIYNRQGVIVVFILVDSVDPYYYNNLDTFVKDFLYYYTPLSIDYYMTIMFSIEDHYSTIKVGDYKSSKYTSTWCTNLHSSITSKMQSKQYNSAFSSILDSVLNYDINPDTPLTPATPLTTTQYIIIGSAVVVVLIALAICGVFMSKGKRNTSIAVSNINSSIEPYGMYDTGYNNNNYYNSTGNGSGANGRW